MSKPKLTLRTLAGCGLLMALSVVLARLLSFAPTQTTRYSLETLPIEEYRKLTDQFDEDVYDAINLENCVVQRNSYGGPSPKAVTDQLDELRYELEQAIGCFS